MHFWWKRVSHWWEKVWHVGTLKRLVGNIQTKDALVDMVVLVVIKWSNALLLYVCDRYPPYLNRIWVTLTMVWFGPYLNRNWVTLTMVWSLSKPHLSYSNDGLVQPSANISRAGGVARAQDQMANWYIRSFCTSSLCWKFIRSDIDLWRKRTVIYVLT